MALVAGTAKTFAEVGKHTPLPRVLSQALNELIASSQQFWWAVAGAFLTYLLTQRRHSFDRSGARR
jgi:hypothetical protein